MSERRSSLRTFGKRTTPARTSRSFVRKRLPLHLACRERSTFMIAQCTNTLRGELEAFHRFPELRLEKHSKTHSRDLGRVLLRTLIRDKVFDGSSYLGNPMSLIHQGGLVQLLTQ